MPAPGHGNITLNKTGTANGTLGVTGQARHEPSPFRHLRRRTLGISIA